MFEKIKKWYSQGLWTADMVQNAAIKGVLTEEQAADVLSKEKEDAGNGN